jgi:hypothetical protein
MNRSAWQLNSDAMRPVRKLKNKRRFAVKRTGGMNATTKTTMTTEMRNAAGKEIVSGRIVKGRMANAGRTGREIRPRIVNDPREKDADRKVHHATASDARIVVHPNEWIAKEAFDPKRLNDGSWLSNGKSTGCTANCRLCGE